MDFRGYGTNSNELGAKKGPKITFFIEFPDNNMFKCMDLSKIVLQGSLPQRKDWYWV